MSFHNHFVQLFVFLLSALLAFAQTTDNAIEVIDLASEKDWTLSIDDSTEWRSIKVPGGGHISDYGSSKKRDKKWVYSERSFQCSD